MSVSLRAFEIHTYKGGKWKIDSVFDDRGLAVLEATRMDESGRHAGIRVIEEEFEEATQKTRVRTIYRGSKIEPSNAAALERAKETRLQVAQRKTQIAQEKSRTSAEIVRAARARKTNPVRLIGLFTTIALLGIGAMLALRFLHDMV